MTRYQYDALNRLTTHTDPDDRVTRFEYDPLGRLTSLKRPNNTETVQNYDLAGNLSSIKHQGPEGLIASFDYTYDQMGNRTAQVEEDGATTAYQYDPLYRLTKVTYPIDKIKKIRDTYLTPPNSVNPPPADGVNKDKSNADKGNKDNAQNPGNGKGKGNAKTQNSEGLSITIASNGNGNGGGGGGNGGGGGDNGGGNGSGGSKDDRRGIGNGKGQGRDRGKHKGWYKDQFGNPIEKPGTNPFGFELPAYLIEPQAEVTYEYDEVGNRTKMTNDQGVTEYRYNEAEQLVAAGDTEYEYDAGVT
ncbi:MAG: RHS repeat domain-containing protein [Bacillota bacterium]